MAYYVSDKNIVNNITINYVLDYFIKKGEIVRIMYGRSFHKPHGSKDYTLGASIIIEPVSDKELVYQDGGRTVMITRGRDICINPWYDKSGINCCKELYNYISDYGIMCRDNKLDLIIKLILAKFII
jgi:hypothetical protein